MWLATGSILLHTALCALWSFFGTVAVGLSADAAAADVLLRTTLAGVVEELLFRSLVLYVLVAGWGRTRRGVMAAVIISALLFGASHLVNLASSAADVTLLRPSRLRCRRSSTAHSWSLAGRCGQRWPSTAS